MIDLDSRTSSTRARRGDVSNALVGVALAAAVVIALVAPATRGVRPSRLLEDVALRRVAPRIGEAAAPPKVTSSARALRSPGGLDLVAPHHADEATSCIPCAAAGEGAVRRPSDRRPLAGRPLAEPATAHAGRAQVDEGGQPAATPARLEPAPAPATTTTAEAGPQAGVSDRRTNPSEQAAEPPQQHDPDLGSPSVERGEGVTPDAADGRRQDGTAASPSKPKDNRP